MSNVLLAGFGTFVTMLALAGFSVWQLDRTAAQTQGPDAAIRDADSPTPPAPDGVNRAT